MLEWKQWSERPRDGQVLALWQPQPGHYGTNGIAMSVTLYGDDWAPDGLEDRYGMRDPDLFAYLTIPREPKNKGLV